MKFKAIAVAMLAFAISAWGTGPSSSSTGFDSLKSLAGEWQAKGPGDQMQTITWKVISDGSAIMESMQEESMVTMYHLDKDHLMVTHYCSAHNQPRMVGKVSDDGKTFTFDFLDATNLASPADGHMRKLVLIIQDKDHFTEQWFYATNGKDDNHGVFQFTRKK